MNVQISANKWRKPGRAAMWVWGLLLGRTGIQYHTVPELLTAEFHYVPPPTTFVVYKRIIFKRMSVHRQCLVTCWKPDKFTQISLQT